jgi:hypothetical protein
MAEDRMRLIWLFERAHLFRRKFDLQRMECVFQML